MGKRIAVVGGGITGLAAVHELVTNGHTDIVLLESSERFGGKIRTSELAGRPIDEGGDAFLARVPWATDLCNELGLGEQLVSPVARQAFIWTAGGLHPLPSPNVLGIPLDPAGAPGALLTELALGALRADMERGDPDPVLEDDTVGSLVRRRLGDEIFERLVNPLLGSINASDMDTLSVHASAPQLAAAAAANPSLINGLLTQRSGTDPDAPVFHSLPAGMAALTDTLAERYRPHLRASAPVVDITKKRRRLRLEVSGGDSETADAVVLTTPSFVSGPIVGEWREASRAFSDIQYVSVVMVTLVYRKADVTLIPGGSGFLIPQTEDPISTACSWASSKWAHLDDGENVILRVSMGYAGADSVLSARDSDLLSTVKLDLAQTMGITEEPRTTRITRWPRSFPQYTVGHLARAKLIRDTLHPDRIYPAGAVLDGIGVPACIRSGREAAKAALAHI